MHPLLRLLAELYDLTGRKNEGYAGATPADPWANYRSAEAWGLTALDCDLPRFTEKNNRAAVLYSQRGADRVGESLRDTLMDAAAIALIAVALLDERTPVDYDPTGDEADAALDTREADHMSRWLAAQADTFG